ncbi:MAG: alpha-amylase family glycosyl hydrolase [Propionibacteriaceae bacterium]|nr:alpha-amylase family glycosyl hydrolase [Propionibacteriaceae bacterium]
MTFSLMEPSEKDSWSKAEWPLGAHVRSDGVTFAIHAPAATRVQLEFFDEAVGAEAGRTYLPAKGPDGVWRAKIAGVLVGTMYGYRVWGRNWPYRVAWKPGSGAGYVSDRDKKGNRFNPNKVLFDPYAFEISHTMYSDAIRDLGVDNGVFGSGGDDYDGVPRRQVDTAPYAPKGVIISDTTALLPKPRIPSERSSIYEAQVQQLCGHPSVTRLGQLLANEPGFEDVVDIPQEYVGTYKGAGMMASYLKALGFTALELLPVHETNASESGVEGFTNAWGYMTLSFFSPNRQYAHDKSLGGPTREFKEMINAFHEVGMEVYLDVVYNHTAEGGNWNNDVGTTGFTTLGGFGTAEYYVMTSDHRMVDGATGTSNQLNYSSLAARALVMDSLIYWTRVMGVDGFRFDLATVLGRLPAEAAPDDWDAQKRFFSDHPLLVQIADFADREQIEVIAEAWDMWGYEVGNFPAGWAEWNGRYRDTVRKFLKGDGNTSSFLDMMNGDHRHFGDTGGPQNTINFVDAHDGFNIADLVSYQEKNNNLPSPFGPSDGGSDDNSSWDSGGDQVLRRQRARNFWTILFLSRGVPMVVAGDEFGRTQNGNNNPWALPSVAMRNNYEMIPTNSPQAVPVADEVDAFYHDNFGTFNTADGVNGLFRFATFIANLRQNHDSLQQKQYGDLVADNKDVSYLYHSPNLTAHPAEGDRALSIFINSEGDNFWMMINMSGSPVDFRVPIAERGRVWRRLIDTHSWAESHHNFWPEGEGEIVENGAHLDTWSIVVLQDQALPAAGPITPTSPE